MYPSTCEPRPVTQAFFILARQVAQRSSGWKKKAPSALHLAGSPPAAAYGSDGATWGQQTHPAARERFGRGPRLSGFERVGADIVVAGEGTEEQADELLQLGFGKAWATDSLACAGFVVVTTSTWGHMYILETLFALSSTLFQTQDEVLDSSERESWCSYDRRLGFVS
ncbi:hypothetical protein PG999_013232 [Apiospora kogelbergensis]|uniref:Uncharacterized protein n=1 Tax=Apiospora kogelbergensis TaxID=1337665 RepID=A0AAW0Q962_9PEZI